MRRNRRPLNSVLSVGLGLLWIWVSAGTWAAAQDGQGTGTSAVAFDPARLSVSQGGGASVKVTVALKSGKTGGTMLKAVDVPGGLAIAFDQPSGEPTFTTTMRVKASPTTTPGTYTVKVQAIGGNPSSAVSYSITVEKTSGY